MKAIEVSEVSALAPHVQPGCSEPLLLTDHGRVVATVVPADEDDAESMLLSINPAFGAILERSRRRLESEGGLSSDEMRKRLGLPAKPAARASRAGRRRTGKRR
jgi:antitoxin (DNA-binding transcriptional repressor) of toxin-antitoxin stability system